MVILNMRFDIGTGHTKINGTKEGVLNRDPAVVESCGPVSKESQRRVLQKARGKNKMTICLSCIS